METKKKENVDALSKKGTCLEFFSAYQDKDLERMIQMCHPEGEVIFEPLGESGKGKIGEFGKNLWMALMGAFPDLDNTVIKADMNDIENTVACTVSIFGTQEKEFAGIPNKGHRFESDHVFVFRFNEDEKIDKINISWDHERFVQQLQA